ncbi:MAG: nucleoside-diphosphate kinase [Candidatus Bathyarchaeota archaeon]|nr:nucleoside-diphosphate kinase [Candidatus Bathyarchaeota archaeon]
MYEETLVILKPDALERRLVGEIIKRYESAGLEVLDIRFVLKVGEDLINRHYPDSMARGLGEKARKASPGIEDLVAHGMKVLERLRRYVTRGPVIAIRMGGEDAIQTVRRETGYTDPVTAEKGTIRGDYGIDSLAKSTEEGRAVENLVHAAGNTDEAQFELALWFPDKR